MRPSPAAWRLSARFNPPLMAAVTKATRREWIGLAVIALPCLAASLMSETGAELDGTLGIAILGSIGRAV